MKSALKALIKRTNLEMLHWEIVKSDGLTFEKLYAGYTNFYKKLLPSSRNR